MNVFNLFCFFGIIPYQFNPVKRTYVTNRVTRNAIQMLFHVIFPSLIISILAYFIREILFFDVRVWRIAYHLRLAISIITLYVNIFENYYNANFHMKILIICTKTCPKTTSKISKRTFRKVTALLIFYIYYEISQYTFVVLYNEQPDEFFFFVTYYYLEMLLLLNMVYLNGLFIALQEFVKSIAHMGAQDQFKLYDLYVRHKATLSSKMSFRLVQLATNTYVVSSALIFILALHTGILPSTNFLEVNRIIISITGSTIQLVGLFSVCYEAHLCTEQVIDNVTV